MYYSPLRYPGGKNKLSAFIAKVCMDNNIHGHYVEPYSGGASVALFLLFEGVVERITINDKDRSIYAFWHSVLNKTEQLCSMIENTDITVEEWRRQKDVQIRKKSANLLELGFSTFFLNRTNRSGIINGGVLGGVEQNGDYLIDCRFNKEELISRIRKIALYKKKISLYRKDALKLIDKIQKDSTNTSDILFYFDPPYYYKACSLYMNSYKYKNHVNVCNKIKNIRDIRWIVSYDNVPEIRNLYAGYSKKEYSFKHTAYKAHIGEEILFFSSNLNILDLTDKNPVYFKAQHLKSGSTIRYKVPKAIL